MPGAGIGAPMANSSPAGERAHRARPTLVLTDPTDLGSLNDRLDR